MNYKRIYSEIILNRVNNPLPEDVYGQKHHVLPRSLYPQYAKTKANIVKLTYREHYICHWLLTKIKPCKQMFNAFWRMNCCQNDLYFNSHAYSEIRRKISYQMHTRIVTEATRQKISKAFKGKIHSDEYKKKMSLSLIGKNKGKKRTDEQRKRISEKCKGINRKPFSEEHRKKLSEANRRRTPPTKNKRWINNGDKQKYIEINSALPEGYVFGRIKKKYKQN